MEHVKLINTPINIKCHSQNMKEIFGKEDSDRNQKLYRSISHITAIPVGNVPTGNRKEYIL